MGPIASIMIASLLLGNMIYALEARETEIDFSQLRGVNFYDAVLTVKQNQNQTTVTDASLERSLNLISGYGYNVIRLNYYWEAYEVNPERFLDEAERVAYIAAKNDLYVIYTFSQWFTSSYFEKKASGFPWVLLNKYKFDGGELESKKFWDDFYNNTIYFKGLNVWDLQVDFMSKIINRVDSYDNVVGYEILNEPHVYDLSQFEKLGKYHTYIAVKLRNLTQKAILFDRATISYAGSIVDDRPYEFERLIAPMGVSNIVFAPHLYAVPYPDTWVERVIENKFERYREEWGGIQIFFGEWAATSEDDLKQFINEFKERGYGWAYFSWNGSDEDFKRLIDLNIKPTAHLFLLTKYLQEIFEPALDHTRNDRGTDHSAFDSLTVRPVVLLERESGNVLLTEISNNTTNSENYIVIILVQNMEGITQGLFLASGVINGHEDLRTRFVWIPESKDSYVVHAFVWSDLIKPVVLSPVRSAIVETTN